MRQDTYPSGAASLFATHARSTTPRLSAAGQRVLKKISKHCEDITWLIAGIDEKDWSKISESLMNENTVTWQEVSRFMEVITREAK